MWPGLVGGRLVDDVHHWLGWGKRLSSVAGLLAAPLRFSFPSPLSLFHVPVFTQPAHSLRLSCAGAHLSSCTKTQHRPTPHTDKSPASSRPTRPSPVAKLPGHGGGTIPPCLSTQASTPSTLVFSPSNPVLGFPAAMRPWPSRKGQSCEWRRGVLPPGALRRPHHGPGGKETQLLSSKRRRRRGQHGREKRSPTISGATKQQHAFLLQV